MTFQKNNTRVPRQLAVQLSITLLFTLFIVWQSHSTRLTNHVNIDGLAGKWNWGIYSHTIVVFTRHGCPYCVSSEDFYKELARKASTDTSVGLLFVTPDSLVTSTLDLPPGVRADSLLPNTDISQYIAATPTFMLVDRSRIVNQVFVGKPSEAVRAALLRAR